MNAALLAVSLLAADGVDTDPDFLAPFLGLTLVDAEDLAREATDPLEPGGRVITTAGPLPAAAPLWAALLPTLSVELIRRQVRQLSGSDILGLSSGTLLLVQATFGLAGGERRSLEDRDRAAPGLRLALSSRVANPATLAITHGLPSIAEIQRATEQAALVRLADLDGWRSRARASAWLPELGLSYQRNVGEIDTLGIQSNLGVDSHNIEDVTRYGVRASWQLGQLVFSREEVAAAKTALGGWCFFELPEA